MKGGARPPWGVQGPRGAEPTYPVRALRGAAGGQGLCSPHLLPFLCWSHCNPSTSFFKLVPREQGSILREDRSMKPEPTASPWVPDLMFSVQAKTGI